MISPHKNIRHYLVHTLMFALLGLAGVPQAMALKSDSDQPATINADDVELDFKTGERIYTGNVFVKQGSMELTCDRLVATFKDDKLAVATAYGSADRLAVFKQRPEGKPNDVIGKAVTMILDQIEELVTLSEKASLNQGTDVMTGQKILYDLKLEKMRIKGSESVIQNPTGSTEPAKPEPTQSENTDSAAQTTAASESTEAQATETAEPDTANDSSTQQTETETTTGDTVAGTASTDTESTGVTDAAADADEATGASESPSMVVPNDSVLSRGTSGRPRMIIQPRSKRNPLN